MCQDILACLIDVFQQENLNVLRCNGLSCFADGLVLERASDAPPKLEGGEFKELNLAVGEVDRSKLLDTVLERFGPLVTMFCAADGMVMVMMVHPPMTLVGQIFLYSGRGIPRIWPGISRLTHRRR